MKLWTNQIKGEEYIQMEKFAKRIIQEAFCYAIGYYNTSNSDKKHILYQVFTNKIKPFLF